MKRVSNLVLAAAAVIWAVHPSASAEIIEYQDGDDLLLLHTDQDEFLYCQTDGESADYQDGDDLLLILYVDGMSVIAYQDGDDLLLVAPQGSSRDMAEAEELLIDLLASCQEAVAARGY